MAGFVPVIIDAATGALCSLDQTTVNVDFRSPGVFVPLSPTLAPGQTKGAEVLVTPKSGVSLRGELIAVKPNSLIIAPIFKDPGEFVSVSIGEVETVNVINKIASKARKGLFWGSLIGVSLTYGIFKLGSFKINELAAAMILGGLVLTAPPLIGALAGGAFKQNELYVFENRNEYARNGLLQKLGEYAAIKGVR